MSGTVDVPVALDGVDFAVPKCIWIKSIKCSTCSKCNNGYTFDIHTFNHLHLMNNPNYASSQWSMLSSQVKPGLSWRRVHKRVGSRAIGSTSSYRTIKKNDVCNSITKQTQCNSASITHWNQYFASLHCSQLYISCNLRVKSAPWAIGIYIIGNRKVLYTTKWNLS